MIYLSRRLSLTETIRMKTSTADTTDTTTGVLKAITWLRALGPILADKMERELLYADNSWRTPNRSQNSYAGSTK